MVILGGYLARLFAMLNYTADGAFVSPQASERAAHLLQWMVDGSLASEEHHLVLNKLLCGLALDTPLVQDVVLSEHELDTARGLLEAVIAHWRALGSTSVAGLRQTFLQREGRLWHEGPAWRLRVAPSAFDMLLDRLPWGLSTVKFPWMTEVLHVEWR